MTCCITRLAKLQFEPKLQKCIRMGITIFKIFIWRSRYIFGYTFGNHVLQLRSRVTINLNFPPYIRRYTSPNDYFEYSYPLIELPGKCYYEVPNSHVLTLKCFTCYMGLNARKPDTVACEQQGSRLEPVHPCSLVSAFVIPLLESIISRLATSKFRISSLSLCS